MGRTNQTLRPQDEAQIEVTAAFVRCHTCEVSIGPDLASSIGEDVAANHLHHDVEWLEWTETEVINDG